MYIYIYTRICICFSKLQYITTRYSSSPILRFLANSVGALHYLVEMKTDVRQHQVSSCNSECMEFISVASHNAVPFLGFAFFVDKNIGAIAAEQALYEVKKVVQAVYSSRQNICQTVIMKCTNTKLTKRLVNQSIYKIIHQAVELIIFWNSQTYAYLFNTSK